MTEEFRWQAFFQRARDPLFVLNRQRRLLFVNRAWEELTGLSAGQVRGLACTRRAPAAPAPTDPVTRALCPPAEVLQGDSARVRRAVEGGRWWEVEFSPLHDDNGLLCILGKITQKAPVTVPPGGSVPEKVAAVRQSAVQRYSLESLTGEGPPERRLVEQVRLAAQSRAAVLITGAPGTGKQWVARTIHCHSGAREQAFAALDCGRLPPAILGATLFGEGGLVQRPGIGTIYLRGPERLPRDLQERVCELLADPDPSTPRLIAGSSADLVEEVRTNRVLEELRCALSPLVLEVRALAQRWGDLPHLLRRLLERLNEHPVPEGGRALVGLTPAAWDCVRAYPWPGNLRELYSVLMDARARARSDHIDAADLPGYLRLAVSMAQVPAATTPRSLPLGQVLQQAERRLIQLALRRTRGNKTRAAEVLALTRQRLLRRMEELGIEE